MKKIFYVWMMFVMIFLVAGNAMAESASIELNGTSQYLTSSSAGLSITGNLTVEIKYKPKTLETDILIQKGITDNLINYRIHTLADGTIDWYHGNNTASLQTSTGAIAVGSYYTISCVVDTSVGRKIFVDGVQKASDTEKTTPPINTEILTIGARLRPTAQLFACGYISEIRVWNVARTATQIADNHNKEMTGTEAGLVALWKFENSMTDSSSTAATLTNVASATYSTIVPTNTTVTETPVTVTPAASNPITTVISQGVAAGLSIGTSQQWLIVGKDTSSVYYLAIAETTGTFIKSITLTSGYVPRSVTQVISGGSASTTQVSVLSSHYVNNELRYSNLLVNTLTGTITPVAW